MCWRNPETFQGKVALNAIDKLVLGLLAAAVIFFIQKCEGEREAEFQERLAISQVETAVISAAVEDISQYMLNYLPIVEGSVTNNILLTEPESTQVTELRDQIRIKLIVIEELAPHQGFDPDGTTAAGELIDTIGVLNMSLRQGNSNITEEIRQTHLKYVYASYRRILVQLRKALIAAAEVTRSEAER